MANSLYEKAAMEWGVTDREQPGAGLYAAALAPSRLRGEIQTHLLSGHFDAAARALGRNPKLGRKHT